MTKVTNAAVIEQGKKLLDYIGTNDIPYVANGMTLSGMDCQGMVEYLLIQAGVPKKECGLAGANAHWRKCVWTGTPEECIRAFGCVPGGAFLFIWEPGHNDKYNDENGNASHMGLVWGKYNSIAASASRGKVIKSNFAGKTINGGWNRVGLSCWVNYGLNAGQLAMTTTPEDGEATEQDSESTQNNAGAVNNDPYPVTKETASFYPVKKGSLGGAVRRLQTWLSRDLGFALSVDGNFGPNTDEAVRLFQRTYNLQEDGIVGKKTWAALAQACTDVHKDGAAG